MAASAIVLVSLRLELRIGLDWTWCMEPLATHVRGVSSSQLGVKTVASLVTHIVIMAPVVPCRQGRVGTERYVMLGP